MRLLLDTHILLWAASGNRRLSKATVALLEDRDNEVWFSAVSVWEVAIKSSLGRADFKVDPETLTEIAEQTGFEELAVRAKHCAGTARLPRLHVDPFDRLLIAQAHAENLTLLTVDEAVLAYGPVAKQA